MDNFFVNIGGLERKYPLVYLSADTKGVYFFLPGDVELIEHCAKIIAEKIQISCDYLLAPETGAVPLAHSIARLLEIDYLVVRKSIRPYMDAPIFENIISITTPGVQTLVIDGRDVAKISGKKVALIDDVISTSGTIKGLLRLTKRCSSQVVCVASIFLEGFASKTEIEAEAGCSSISLGYLPLFHEREGIFDVEI